MKKYLYILLLFLLPAVAAFSQDEDPAEENGKIAERMREYIQKVKPRNLLRFLPVTSENLLQHIAKIKATG